MQWTDVTRTPDTRLLRQFAALCVLLFGTAGGWRAGTGAIDEWTITLAVLTGGGALGMLWPRTVRWFYTVWMIAAFPVGWTVSRAVVAVLFFGLFTPLGMLFRLTGRDVLHLRRHDAGSYWVPKPRSARLDSYLRQY